ncbi:hypothetical protein N303_14128, partial [Cuculus canorus]
LSCIPKKSRKWHLLHDLRKVNDQMWPMGALQPGMPLPTMLPKDWHLLVIDLKDCFFTIPLQLEDTLCFAFTLPLINKAEPAERFEWVVLPQGTKNSPTMYQLFVSRALKPIRKQLPDTLIYHYMDDILLCQKEPITDMLIKQLESELNSKGLIIAPKKVQRRASWKYLGWTIASVTVRLQQLILTPSVKTLNDAQKLVGDLQWIRNILGITNEQLAPFMPLLHG